MSRSTTVSLLALLYTLPLLLWAVTALESAGDAQAARQLLQHAVAVTLLLQSLAPLLLHSLVPPATDRRPALSETLRLLLPPWPLLALAWLAGASPLALLLLAEAGLLLAALLWRGLVDWIEARIAAPLARRASRRACRTRVSLSTSRSCGLRKPPMSRKRQWWIDSRARSYTSIREPSRRGAGVAAIRAGSRG